MARRNKKVRGTTTRAGKTTRSPVARVSADRIERPHSGKKVVVKGAQTAVEANALRGPTRAGSSSVRQVGPSSIRPAGRSGPSSVRTVGEGMPADDQSARRELAGGAPGRRQPGSVRQVGPPDTAFARLVQRSPSPALQTQIARYRPKRPGRPISSTPLLKSGVGRAHPWALFAGQPGTVRGGVRGVGPSTQQQTLVSGRRRAFRSEPFPANADWVTPTQSVVPGS